jgi:hypothetical protein
VEWGYKTWDGNSIDVYDGLKVMERSTESSPLWNVWQGSFEAAWGVEGALCLSHTRDGRVVEAVMAECPDRLQRVAKDLGEGDRCTVVRKGGQGRGGAAAQPLVWFWRVGPASGRGAMGLASRRAGGDVSQGGHRCPGR